MSFTVNENTLSTYLQRLYWAHAGTMRLFLILRVALCPAMAKISVRILMMTDDFHINILALWVQK